MIRFFNPAKGYKKYQKEYDAAYRKVMASGNLVLREDVEKFENNLASYIDVRYAVGLNSGTDALELALRALKIGKGDEVITVSNTFKATITAIKKVGATPVLVDINDNYLMDTDMVAGKVTSKTKAIIPVHLAGDVCEMDSLHYSFPIIEDAAQAFGATFKTGFDYIDGRPQFTYHAGGDGKIGCFSFYPAKILGGFGDAGAITTNDKQIADWIRNYRNHCKDKPGEDGMNSRLDNLQAAFLNVKIRHIKEILARRKEIAQMYDEGLMEVDDVITPRPREVYQDYIIRTGTRNKLFNHLKEKRIETMKPPILPHIELGIKLKLPKTEEYNEQFLRLPCNENLTDKEVDYVIKTIRNFYGVR